MSPKAPFEQRQKIYRSLCYVLSERIDQVGWDGFSPADWDLFAQMAEREGVAPLMYWTFKRSNVQTLDVPANVFAALKDSYYKTLAQNTLMYQELERILTALDEAGIDVIVLKGAALAATVYEDIGLRPMGDLDLLVREEQLDDGLEIMQSLDFRRSQPELRTGIDRLVGYNVKFMGQQNLALELHWDLGKYANWHLLPRNWFWERSTPLRLPRAFYKHRNEFSPGARTYNFLPDAHILYLSIHLSLGHGSGFVQLLWFYDLQKMVSIFGHDIDWRSLAISAKRGQLFSGLVDALKGVESRFGTELVLELEDYSSGEGGERNTSRSDIFRINTPRIRNEFKRLKWPARLRLIFAYIFPTLTWMRWRYKPKPSWIWPLLYPYRWIELIIKRSRISQSTK